MNEYIRPSGRNGRAPKGNQNASKRPTPEVLRLYQGKLGEMTREELAAKLGVAVSTTYRWMPAGSQK